MKIKIFMSLMVILVCNASEAPPAPALRSSRSGEALREARISEVGSAAAAPSSSSSSAAPSSSCSAVPSSSSSAPSYVSPTKLALQAKIKQTLDRLAGVKKIMLEHTNVELDINDKDSMTTGTFRELIEDHIKQNAPLIIAQVNTNDAGREVKHYFDAYLLNRHLFGPSFFVPAKNRYNTPAISGNDAAGLPIMSFPTEPLNRQVILGNIQYYVFVPSNPFLFKYLGSDYDLHQNPDNSKRIAMVNTFIAGMTQFEATEFLNKFIGIAITLNGASKPDVELLESFAKKSNLSYSDQLRIAKLFTTIPHDTYTTYDPLSKIIDNPDAPDEIKLEAKKLQEQELKLISPVGKLQLGNNYFWGKNGFERNDKYALEILQDGLSLINERDPAINKNLVIDAKIALMYIYYRGNAGNRDYKKAMSLIEELINNELSSKKTLIQSLQKLIYIYVYGGFGVEKDIWKALSAIQRLYKLDPANLLIDPLLGLAGQLGQLKNYVMEKEILEMVLKQPHADPCTLILVQNRLAGMYFNGLGVQKNLASCIALYKSIINNSAECKNSVKEMANSDLGVIYYKGERVPRDIAFAKECFERVLDDQYAGPRAKEIAERYLKLIAEIDAQEEESARIRKMIEVDDEEEGEPRAKRQKLGNLSSADRAALALLDNPFKAKEE